MWNNYNIKISTTKKTLMLGAINRDYRKMYNSLINFLNDREH